MSSISVKGEGEFQHLYAVDEGETQYVFRYRITIENHSTKRIQIISRYWRIEHADVEVEEVNGEGVVGKMPFINRGETFEYESSALLATPVGTMQGQYQAKNATHRFTIDIPPFNLVARQFLH